MVEMLWRYLLLLYVGVSDRFRKHQPSTEGQLNTDDDVRRMFRLAPPFGKTDER